MQFSQSTWNGVCSIEYIYTHIYIYICCHLTLSQ
jgi:hypothetical protein